MWSGSGDYRDLLKADHLYLNDRLGKFYGTEVTSDGFENFDGAQPPRGRAHPSAVARAVCLCGQHLADSSGRVSRPTHRRPHTPTAASMPFNLRTANSGPNHARKGHPPHQGGRLHELPQHHQSAWVRAGKFRCHRRWRTKEKGRPINSSSEYITATNTPLKLTGPRTIANYAADSPHGQRHFIEQLFNHLAKQA